MNYRKKPTIHGMIRNISSTTQADILMKLTSATKIAGRLFLLMDGNPVLRSYKKFCEKHGGTVVAHEHECVKTIDGILRDTYGFEILARNYIPSSERVVQS